MTEPGEQMTETPDPGRKSISQNMTTMETSITDLQGELNVANEPSRNHFKPGWLIVAIVVALLVGTGSFLVASRFKTVDHNSEAIQKTCKARNEELEIVNAKFNQLVALFDASFQNRPVDQPPPAEEVLALYEKFRAPIRILDCNKEFAVRQRAQ